MHKHQISVVIPTYNRPLYLCELIESLLRQTLQPMEIIIVNDGGESVEFVRALYPELFITVINPDPKPHHVMARNLGIQAASGSHILLCDDDDLLLPLHMEESMKVMEKEGADFIHTDAEMVEFKVENGCRVPVNRRLFAYDYSLEDMRTFSTFIPSGTIYRREIHEQIGYLDPAMNNYWDWDFFLRVCEKYKVRKLPMATVLYAYGHSSNSAIHTKMRIYLDKLCTKHNLKPLPTNNFTSLLLEPGLQARASQSLRTWDGKPIRSRNKRGTDLDS
ncbi:glycosyltransferase [Bacillus sp. AFS015802]|uniref:glycosyltransferase family 2 protein n=1 Tax=Bacillus sp. AFS015802 TaxID=2033486 RepID=UPI000BF59522|nr:glycosyltransferase family A protein [Bacillus sp. AFS015802]PFA67291.1 glycosyltransferase [Bacillus sp. AFS015802]